MTDTIQPAPSRRTEFATGVRATLPLILGAIPFGLIFGAVAVTSGLTPAATHAMSAFVYAGSAQFIAAGMVAQGVPIGIIVVTTFVVNLRHALYSASLAPYLKRLPQRWLAPLGFWLTDETYAAVISRWQTVGTNRHSHWFYLGSALAMYLNWQLVTALGVIAGGRIPDPASWGLDYALVVTFIGIVVPLVASRPMLVSVVAASAVALAANGLPNKLGLMLAAGAGIAAGMAAEMVWPGVENRRDAQAISPAMADDEVSL